MELDRIALIDRLRSETSEREWFEFKRNHYPPEQIGEYLSALANSAALAEKPRGFLIFGIDDSSHDVVGTKFDPHAVQVKGNQSLLHWTAARLQPHGGVEVCEVQHPDGRLVVFEVQPATDRPVSFNGVAYIRVGSSKTELSKHPEKERALWTRRTDWSAGLCEGASLNDLDPSAIVKAREQFAVKHPGQAAAIASWDDTTFLNKARLLRRNAVTRTALLLLGRTESATLLSPAVAKITWVLKDAANRELDYEHFGPPFVLAGDRLQKRIRNLTVRALPSGTLFPQEISQYDPWVIREALHNCIAHQDYGLHGRINVVETPDCVLLTNVGSFLPGSVGRVIEQDAPPEVYRNPFLADAMVELNLIDTQGGGIKRMFETQRKRWFPMPDYDLSNANRVAVTIPGRILDERYTRMLMERTDLSLPQVVMLDRIQKRLPVERDQHLLLKRAGLVEGRYPSLMIAGEIAKATGSTGRHIRERGFDKRYYLDLILELVREHEPVSRQEVDDALVPKLPDRYSAEQKKAKVHNLLGELARGGRIWNSGSRSRPQWRSGDGR